MTEQESRSTPIPGPDRDAEPVSALVDGELDARGAAFLIRRVGRDDGLRRRWQRFHLVRACLQREFNGPVALVARVHDAVEREHAPAASSPLRGRLLRLGGGGAVAAAVALVAIAGLGNRVEQQAPGPAAEDGSVFVSETTALDRQFSLQAVPAGFGGAADAADRAEQRRTQLARERINRYVIRHSQIAGSNGFISFTPVLTAPSDVDVERASPATTARSGDRGANE